MYLHKYFSELDEKLEITVFDCQTLPFRSSPATITIAPTGTWKCNFTAFIGNYDRPHDQPTDRPTNILTKRSTDQQAYIRFLAKLHFSIYNVNNENDP